MLAVLGLAGLGSAVAAYLLLSYVQGVRQDSALAKHAEEVFRSPHSFVAGSPEGDVSVVAYFDYNCPYCRHGAPALVDGKVRLVLKELPVLGADSDAVARIAQAAIAQGKYFELMRSSSPSRAGRRRARRSAWLPNLDSTAKLEQDAQSPAIEGALAANERLAANLSVRGVPFYLVGDKRVRASGDLYAQPADAVVEIRQNGCRAAC